MLAARQRCPPVGAAPRLSTRKQEYRTIRLRSSLRRLDRYNLIDRRIDHARHATSKFVTWRHNTVFFTTRQLFNQHSLLYAKGGP